MTTPSEEYRTIPLTKGQVAIVDAADYEWLSQWNWYANYSKTTKHFYAMKWPSTAMHRLILGLRAGNPLHGDHANRNTLDNRRENLRIATVMQNQWNRGVSKTKRFPIKGIFFHKTRRQWVSTITVNKVRIWLGTFSNCRDAYSAYRNAEVELYGRFSTCRNTIIGEKEFMMADEIQNENPTKPKRAYIRKQPASTEPPIAEVNQSVLALEADVVPLVRQRLETNRRLAISVSHANQANAQVDIIRGELQQVESEIQYRMQLIAQLRNGGMPVPSTPYVATQFQPPAGYPPQQYGFPPSPPYNPVTPYPTAPPFGVSSFPAPNQGLYPDAVPRGFISDNPEEMANTASAADFRTPELRAQLMGGR